MNPFQRSWLLLKCSLAVIGQHKRLLLFPIVVATLTMLIVGFCLLPPVLRPTGYSYTSVEHWKVIWHSLFTSTDSAGATHTNQYGLTPVAYAYTGFVYFLCMFLATFFNVAFYHEILEALGGGEVSLSRGIQF